MRQFVICPVNELQEGETKIVEIEGKSIGIFNVKGQFYALRNRCPHKGAPLCEGLIKGVFTSSEPYKMEIERDGEIVRCPWHSWEFDITTGKSIFNPHRMRVKSYEVTVDDDPAIDTYPVKVEQEVIVLHMK